MSVTGTCKLCRRDDVTLRKSHVIPNFVIQWMRESSIGFMRDGTNADRRIQDGPKFPWFCEDCEQRLSTWESPFAEKVFSYIHRTSADQKPVPYGPWALKFAVSISWRTLLFSKQQSNYDLTGENGAAADRAEERWRRFLLDEEPHSGPFEQHLLCVDAPASATGPISPFMSRYLTRTVALDLPTSATSCLTYAKLCRVIIFGFVRQSNPRKWRGTKVTNQRRRDAGRPEPCSRPRRLSPASS